MHAIVSAVACTPSSRLRPEYGAGDADAHVAERVAAARRFEPHDFERVRPSGQVLRVKGVPVPGIGFITLYSDITASKQAEAQIRQDAAELERRVAERTRELRLSEAELWSVVAFMQRLPDLGAAQYAATMARVPAAHLCGR